MTSNWLSVYKIIDVGGVGLEFSSRKNLIHRIASLLCSDSIFAIIVIVSIITRLDGELFLRKDVIFVY
jgi:hypothetical protein